MADLKEIKLAIRGDDLASKPLGEIGKAIDQLVENVTELVPATEKGEKSLSELSAVAAKLREAMKGLLVSQAIINDFQSLTAAVTEGDAKLAQYKARVEAAKAAIAGTTTPTKAMVNELNASQAAAAAAERQLTGLNARLERNKAAAAEAGIDTARLAEAQRKLDEAFRAAVPAQERAAHAIATYHKEGAEVEGVLGGLKEKAAELVVEFVGLYGIIEQVHKGFEGIEKLETSEALIRAAVGAKELDKELEYVRSTADRVGLNFQSLAIDYGRFINAAKGSGFKVEDVRATFETFAEISRIRNKSVEETSNIFTALQKIFAKDSVSVADLFKRLEAELPDVAGAFRKAFKIDGQILRPEQFDALLKAGAVTGRQLIAFAKEYRQTIAGELEDATTDFSSNVARFGNAFDKLRADIIKQGGALDQFSAALKTVNDYLNSESGKKFAEDLGLGLKKVAEGFVFLANNLGTLKLALEGFVGLWALKVTGGILTDAVNLATSFVEGYNGLLKMTAGLGGAGPVASRFFSVFAQGFAAIGVAFSAYNFGTWLYESIEPVRRYSQVIVGTIVDSFADAIAGIKELWARFRNDPGYPQLRLDDAAASKARKDTLSDLINHSTAAKKAAEQKSEAGGAEGESGESGKADAKALADEKDRAERAKDVADSAFKSIRQKISEMNAKLLEANATEIDAYRAGLVRSVQPIRDELEKLGKEFDYNSRARVKQLNAELDAYIKTSIAQKQAQLAEADVKRQFEDVNAILRDRQLEIANINALQTQGRKDPGTARKEIFDITVKSNAVILSDLDKIQTAFNALPEKTRQSLHGLELQIKSLRIQATAPVQERDTFSESKEGISNFQEQLKIRSAAIQDIRDKEHLGIIDQREARVELQRTVEQYNPLLKAVKLYVDYLKTTPDLTDEQRSRLSHLITELEIEGKKQELVNTALLTGAQVADSFASGGVGIAKAFAEAEGHGRGLSASFHAAGVAFRQFAADFLLKIGEMILQQTILNALSTGAGKATTGGIASFFGRYLSSQAHSGGLVGDSVGLRRMVLPEWFDNAPRMHTGGIAGLKSDEVPAILQRGEEVLAKNDARNAGNGGRSGGSPQHIQVVNAIDHASVVEAGLKSPSNTKVILNLVRANRNAFRQVLN